jgi:hypothetical protein
LFSLDLVRVHRLTTILATLGVMALMFAYTFMSGDHVLIQQRDYTRAEHPQLFATLVTSCLLAGVLLLAAAFYAHFRLQLRRVPSSGPFGISWFGIIMFGLGLIFALAAILAGAFHR